MRFDEMEFYRYTSVFTPTAPLIGGCEGRVTFVQTGGLPGREAGGGGNESGDLG